jgi:hypothetical protein
VATRTRDGDVGALLRRATRASTHKRCRFGTSIEVKMPADLKVTRNHAGHLRGRARPPPATTTTLLEAAVQQPDQRCAVDQGNKIDRASKANASCDGAVKPLFRSSLRKKRIPTNRSRGGRRFIARREVRGARGGRHFAAAAAPFVGDHIPFGSCRGSRRRRRHHQRRAPRRNSGRGWSRRRRRHRQRRATLRVRRRASPPVSRASIVDPCRGDGRT